MLFILAHDHGNHRRVVAIVGLAVWYFGHRLNVGATSAMLLLLPSTLPLRLHPTPLTEAQTCSAISLILVTWRATQGKAPFRTLRLVARFLRDILPSPILLIASILIQHINLLLAFRLQRGHILVLLCHYIV